MRCTLIHDLVREEKIKFIIKFNIFIMVYGYTYMMKKNHDVVNI